MASKRGHVSRGLSSRVAPTPNALTFPNLKFLSEAHAGKFLKLVDYHIVRKKEFNLNDLREFYANAAFGDADSYTSYVRDLFCRPYSTWVIERGLALRLKLDEFLQIPRAWASFFVQTLEATSNQSQFIVKRCLGILAFFEGEPINLGRRAGVPVYLDDGMISMKSPLNGSFTPYEEMDNYFINQDQEQARRRDHMGA
ncbi:hypothetical protein KIW84_063960 [Lathyrus oleraceus]|uniref:Uncharacterized protein n=1 Tax=Pisum sativum TaxID=3888 RepID=A0A9D4WAA6_PEA|nr:hypothetical protein KIW84_063960 [Pisum sativum]